MKPTLTQMNKWFDEFNAVVFANELPMVKITFTNTRRQLGQFYWGSASGIGIKISTFYDRKEEGYRNTLLHEMCHLYCYRQGWVREGHGNRWKAIADKAYKITGLYIQRTQTDEVFVPRGAENKAKMQAVKAKKNAPAILVDIDYGTYHFIVKTTKRVIWDASDGKVIKGKKVSGVYICDNKRVLNWQNSRSLNRGYKFPNWEYNKDIAPMLSKAVKIDNLRKLCQRDEYDYMGIR